MVSGALKAIVAFSIDENGMLIIEAYMEAEDGTVRQEIKFSLQNY